MRIEFKNLGSGADWARDIAAAICLVIVIVGFFFGATIAQAVFGVDPQTQTAEQCGFQDGDCR